MTSDGIARVSLAPRRPSAQWLFALGPVCYAERSPALGISLMLTLAPSSAAHLHIRASGRLTAADYRRFEPAFAAELERRKVPTHCLLLDMRGFRGWTPGGFLRDLAWDLRNRRTFSRIAVIGDEPWHRLITAVGRPLFRAPMKFFHSEEQTEAWLR